MRIRLMPSGMLMVNTYLVTDEENKKDLSSIPADLIRDF